MVLKRVQRCYQGLNELTHLQALASELRAPSLADLSCGQPHAVLASPSFVHFSPWTQAVEWVTSFATSIWKSFRTPLPQPIEQQPKSSSEKLTDREWRIVERVAHSLESLEARAHVERVIARAKNDQTALKISHLIVRSPRSLYVTAAGAVHVKLSRKRKGDKLLGSGMSKHVYKAPELLLGASPSSSIRVAAYCAVKRNAENPNPAAANRREFEYGQALLGTVDPNSFCEGIRKDSWLDELKEGDLVDALAKRQINFSCSETRRNIAIQLADQIAKIHLKGFFHRDIKPENVLYSFDSMRSLSIQLTDVGLVIAKDAPVTSVCGSPMYSSPEAFVEAQRQQYNQDLLCSYATEQHDGWQLGSTLLGLFFEYLDPQFLQDNPKIRQWRESASSEGRLIDWLYTNWVKSPLCQEDWIKRPQNESSMEYVLYKLLAVDPAQRWTPAQALDALSS